MKIEKIHCANGNDQRLWANYTERLLTALLGTVFHLTSQHASNLIQESGAVEHNKNERFKLNTASQESFGRLMGWVCLFDFRTATSECITDILDRYDFLSPSWFISGTHQKNWQKRDLAYLILDSKYYDRLIPYEKFNEHFRDTGQFPMAVPKYETWIPNRVPITWIKKIILANILERLTDEAIQHCQAIDWAHRNLPWNISGEEKP